MLIADGSFNLSTVIRVGPVAARQRSDNQIIEIAGDVLPNDAAARSRLGLAKLPLAVTKLAGETKSAPGEFNRRRRVLARQSRRAVAAVLRNAADRLRQ